MAEWQLVENPAYAGRMPERLTPACHDGSPPLTVQCSCGGQMHLHESQLAEVPIGATIGSRCKSCHDLLELNSVMLRRAFQQMRDQGWHQPESPASG